MHFIDKNLGEIMKPITFLVCLITLNILGQSVAQAEEKVVPKAQRLNNVKLINL